MFFFQCYNMYTAKWKSIKIFAEDLCLGYHMKLSIIKEEAEEFRIAGHLCIQNRIKEHRSVSENIWHIAGKTKGDSTTKVTLTCNEGNVK